MKVLITGASGLIGSSVAKFYLDKNTEVVGIDNDMRKNFFGSLASTYNQEKLLKKHTNYTHLHADIRSQSVIAKLFKNNKFDLIVHTAAQPSHDKAKEIPLIDADINTRSTLQLLELARKYQDQAVFVFTSTNKVYGDNPNKVPMIEDVSRYSYQNIVGVNEKMSVDQNVHSLFGVSKLAADMYVQEYGRNFGLKTSVFRLGCVTGAAHAGTRQHGFLSFLIKSLVKQGKYTIIGYKGKQVRDQIHAEDVAAAIHQVYLKPTYGDVFNMGGGLKNSASVIELIRLIESKIGIKADITYSTQARSGDHICYITDLTKFSMTYPDWQIKRNLESIIDEIIEHEKNIK